jgi:hypothetical protein
MVSIGEWWHFTPTQYFFAKEFLFLLGTLAGAWLFGAMDGDVKIREREREFSPATCSAATEKWWSYGVQLCAVHWLLSSRGEWTPARCTAPRGNFLRLLGHPACMVVIFGYCVISDGKWLYLQWTVTEVIRHWYWCCYRSDKVQAEIGQ